MTNLCVFCGSALGVSPKYAAAARDLASAMTALGIGLVYGGAHRGLMGVLADAVLERGGEVIGVIPQALVDREIAHRGITKLIVVADMHERKAAMAAHADAFVALPGGFGTLEEWMEVVTWAQLGLHAKPIGLFDVDGYFAGLLAFIEHMLREGFVQGEDVARLVFARDLPTLFDRLFRTSRGTA